MTTPLASSVDMTTSRIKASSFNWFIPYDVFAEKINMIPVKTKEQVKELKQKNKTWQKCRTIDGSSRCEDGGLYEMAPPDTIVSSKYITTMTDEVKYVNDPDTNECRQTKFFTFELQREGESIGYINGAFSIEGSADTSEKHDREVAVELSINAVVLNPEYRGQGLGRALSEHISDYFGGILNDMLAEVDASTLKHITILPTVYAEAYSRSGYNFMYILHEDWGHSVALAVKDALSMPVGEAGFDVGL